MTEILVTDFIKGLLIFLRIVAILFVAPVFSNKSIPTPAKLFLSLLMAYMIFFTVDSVNYNVEEGLMPLILLGIKEVFIGIIMGFMLNFVFYAISYGGLIIGYDMGLAMAQMFDPTTESQTNIMGRTMMIMAMLIFLAIDGHYYAVRGVAYSFTLIPLGNFAINEPLFDMLIKFSGGIFILAVKIASPIMVSFFLLHIGSGIIARVMPQMNVFFVVHPLKMMLGFGLLISLTPLYVFIIRELLQSYEDKLFNFIQVMSN